MLNHEMIYQNKTFYYYYFIFNLFSSITYLYMNNEWQI